MKSSVRTIGIGLVVFFGLASTVHAEKPVFPETIPLPDGFAPEGIERGMGPELFAGSLVNGAVYRVDARTGAGEFVVQPQPGRVTVGLAYDPRSGFIFAAGGPTGVGSVYSAATGETLEEYELATPATFINDVVVTRDAAYFTDSFGSSLYRVPLASGGMLMDAASSEELPLTGDFLFVPGAFNANGITSTADAKWLIISHTARESIYRVNPSTGEAVLIDLGGAMLPNADGLLLRGRTLYVVQNLQNQVAVVELAPDLRSGDVVELLTSPNFDVPTTVTDFGDALYLVNARFGTPPLPATGYDIVRISR